MKHSPDNKRLSGNKHLSDNKRLSGNKRLTDNEKWLARTLWYRTYPYKELDRKIEPYLSIESDLKTDEPDLKRELNSKKEFESWLSQARAALFLSSWEVAHRMGISQSSYSALERREKAGTISLGKLRKVAEVMDCELVYAIRPKKRRLFSEVIWRRVLAFALRHPWAKRCDQRRRGYGVAAIAVKAMRSPHFRRDVGWVQFKDTKNDEAWGD